MEGLVDAIDTLLAFVPERHRAWVEAAMALLWALGGLLAVARPLLARWVPSGPGRYWLDAVDSILHAASASSKRLADRPAPPPKVKR